MIADQAEAKGNSAFGGIAHGRRDARVRHRHNDIGLRRCFSRKLSSEFLPALLYGAPENQAIGTRKVHMLEDAARLRSCRGIQAGNDAFRSNHDQFTRLDFPLVSRTDQIERTGFGSEHNRVLLLAFLLGNASHGQWAEATRIAGGKNSIWADHHQRKRAFNAPKSIGHGFGQSMFFGKSDEVNDHFSIAVGLKDRALRLQARTNFWRIYQISIVRQRHSALIRLHQDGLCV